LRSKRQGFAMGMVVNCAAYEDGRRVADIDIDKLDDWPAKDGRVIWIGLHEPDEDLLTKLQRHFGLHELAIEDAHVAHQRPKLEVYGDSLFLVLRTAQMIEGKLQLGETHIFAGRGYVISVRHGPSVSYAEVRRRCEQAPKMLKKGEDFIVYALMDFVVDSYFPIVTGMQDEVSAIENRVFQDTFDQSGIEHIYDLRSDLLTLRNVARASMVAMMAGADFIKTSTGKEAVNATLPVGLVMTRAIREYARQTGMAVGFKPAGGIRTAKQSIEWLALMKEELGASWMNAKLFRLGASSMLADIERQLEFHATGRYSAEYRHPLA